MAQNCQHPGCTCAHDESRMLQRNGAFYCSEHCASHTRHDGPCACGHPDCVGTSNPAKSL